MTDASCISLTTSEATAGDRQPDMGRCPTCRGIGEVPKHYPIGRNRVQLNWERCPTCDGRREIDWSAQDA